MLTLLDRRIAALANRFVLLAPPAMRATSAFSNVLADDGAHTSLLHDVQKLRGSIYLEDGALHPRQLAADGRHCTPEDDRSWHLLFLNPVGKVSACVWYLGHHDAAFEDLRVRRCPLATAAGSRAKLLTAVQSELARARIAGLQYAEVGGWAVSRESRCTAEGLLLALAAYSLARLVGGALGVTTATVRHGSSSILRRIGGSPLDADGEAIPPYYDPAYRCTMELLRFDSRTPNEKYAPLIDRLAAVMREALLVQPYAEPAVAATLPATALSAA